MKELRVHVFCDVCLTRGDRVEVDTEAGTFTIKLRPDDPGRTLDLCEKDRAALLDPVLDFLALRGPGGKLRESIKAKAEAGFCPVCNEAIVVRNMVRHLSTQHDVTIPPTPTTCPDCGFAPEDPAKSMSGHRYRAHGWRQLDELLEEVARRGR